MIWQCTEVNNSHWCELEGLKRIMKMLMEDYKLQIDSIVTDRHTQVAKWIKENLSDKTKIIHYFDVWHMAKGLVILTKIFNVYIPLFGIRSLLNIL